MNKKLQQLGKKTGLSPRETSRLTRFGISGLLGAVLFLLAACAKPAPKPAEQTPETATPAVEPSVSQSSTATAVPAASTGSKKQDGPWEGYPAGTRYATVAAADFA